MTKEVNLIDNLKHYFGFDNFKGEQEAIIRHLLAGYDAFVLMPTGGGKSLCYQLPSLIMEGTAVVVSPLIALMKNQVDVINGISEGDGVAHYLNSSLKKAEVDKVRTDIREGKTKLLYVAPESLNKEDNIEFLKTVKVSFYAIDDIIKYIKPQGTVMLMGVSENKVGINTRDILEKGLTFVGSSRSGYQDFVRAIEILQDEKVQKRLKLIIENYGVIKKIEDIHKVFNFDLNTPFKTVFRWEI